ncbi:MAG: DUF4295 domain-containing protein [Bacteroidales bacterium]|jgi:hypothetical protein|nr:DUF4295 domain-containing protein [Bacteroidales bacterium]MDD2618790.1 DUF4295 domain-containing protein [Bacteroidales bacterium]MDD3430479.1 DUF4295 domain-containing protein [Bacteroidales bacterium]MDD4360915.1 DUF4295 domain-containing protein [Bacteroidales bacterium]MDD4429829.1 DUF4295 domain-containing protein [Bacteroidales bacterium]
MAKKTVATLRNAGSRNTVKVIKMVKAPETGSYSFKEEMVPVDKVNEYLKK